MRDKLDILGLDFTLGDGPLEYETGGGYCNVADQFIGIDSDQHRQAKKLALIHEYIEAVNELCDLHLPHQTVATLAVAVNRLVGQL